MAPVHATSVPHPGRYGGPRKAFTLVELMVVIVIALLLGSLALGGLFSARQRIKIDKTRNTIRKIHEIVIPHYEGYLRRRVPRADPVLRLRALRQLIVHEMPDSWGDVFNSVSAVTALPDSQGFQKTGPVLAYAATKSALGATVVAQKNWSAECLYMIVSCGSGEPDAMERFRADEVGDTDNDRAPEFLDAWGNPIGFIRWAPGASSPLAPGAAGLNSPVQVGDPTRFHDPLDPMRVDPNGFALVPLIVSSGPDQISGLVTTGTGGWLTYANASVDGVASSDGRGLSSATGNTWLFQTGTFLITGTTTVGMADAAASTNSWADNITNHDLMKK